MPLADWLHKYPGVAALLQTETDEVLGASVEEDASTFVAAPRGSPLTGREAWYDAVLRWGRACLRRYQAQGLYLCVAPDLYAVLAAQARLAGERGPLHVCVPAPGAPSALRLCGRMTILPWPACAPGTWLAHWSEDADHLRLERCPPGGVSWAHPLRAAIGPEDGIAVMTLCRAHAPALICPCGGFLLHWE